jgi:hypothetical protein
VDHQVRLGVGQQAAARGAIDQVVLGRPGDERRGALGLTRSTTNDPRNPAPPVTTTRFPFQKVLIERRNLYGSALDRQH